MTPTANAVLFVLLGGGVWYCGVRLTRLADAIADRFSLARSAVGVVFLASATSLPELATTVTGALENAPELVLNNLFGGIVLQTAMLAVADLWCGRPLLNAPRRADHVLEATLLIVLLALVQLALVAGEPLALGWVGVGASIVGISYIVAIFLLRRYDRTNDWVPVDLPPTPAAVKAARDVAALSPRGLLGIASVICLAIVVLGVGLVISAERLAVDTGLGNSFVGVVFLSAATSLPELSTTIAAVRMRAYTLAISNVFGSNLIMIVLVWPADALTTAGPILRGASQTVLVAVTMGILVTATSLVGLLVRRKPTLGRVGIDSVAILAVYGVSLGLFWWLR